MDDDRNPTGVRWQVALRADAAEVFRLLASDEGRARFWAEAAPERDGFVHFHFPDGSELRSEVVACQPPSHFALRYFDHSTVRFTLRVRPEGGCVVTLEEQCEAEETARENAPGWVSVLLNLKAVADFGVDLRNHDASRCWRQGYVDN